MAFDYSVTNLLQAVRDVANVGTSTRDWPDDKLLRLLNRKMQDYLLPLMMQARRHNHFATFVDTQLVAGTNSYWLPSKAIGEKARAVQLVDASGNPYAPLVEGDLEEIINWGNSIFTGPAPQDVPRKYYFQGNKIVLWPIPPSAPVLSLRIYYLARPSTLVLNAACVALTSLPGGAPGGSFRVGYTGTAPAGYIVGAACDLVQNVAGFDVQFSGLISATGAGYFEFVGTLPPLLAVGDWLCLSDTAPVVTGAIPEAVVGCLIDRMKLDMMDSKADDFAFNRGMRLLAKDEKSAVQFLNRRNTGAAPKVGAGSLGKFRTGGFGGRWD